MSTAKELIKDKCYGIFDYEGDWLPSATIGYRSPMEHYPEVWWIEGEAGPSATYNPEIIASGKVRISVYIIGNDENQDKNVEYTVFHNGLAEKIYVDTSLYKKGASDWHELGVFDFCGNGEEYVKITRVSTEGVTRASVIKFDILNDSGAIDVWQTIYTGPDLRNLKPVGLYDMNVFDDIKDQKQKYCAEYLASLNIIESDLGEFNPYEKVSPDDFIRWFNNAAKTNLEFKDDVTLCNIAEPIYFSVLATNKNFEWVKSETAIDFLFELGVFCKADIDVVLSRIEAVEVIKNYYHYVVNCGVDKDKWELTFCDNFEGDTLDFDVWESQNCAPGHIASSRWVTNVDVKDGKLYLLTKKEKKDCCPNLDWTTGSVSVKPSVFSQSYGYWEASIKINAAQGINNAFWMATDCEIDIVEAHYKNVVNTNLHHEKGVFSERYRSGYNLSEDFHIYALEWTENELIYFFDGEEIARKNSFGANHPMSPILSTAVLNWAGKIGDEADGCAMETEWVRVYKRK